LDFSSGVLVANCGHNHPKVNQAIRAKLDQGLLTCYIFPHPDRVILLEKILGHCPQMMDQGLLFCSGSEAIEAAIKLSKNYASQHSKTKYSSVV
jgi:4-aminobutyrate aminotransferase-like enzyme